MSIETDGRTMRRSRNRDAVIDALLALIREGQLEPTTAEIAIRAGVSHRSVFRYFDDLDDLRHTAIATEFRAAASMIEIPQLGDGPLETRVTNLVAARLALFERLRGAMLVARAHVGTGLEIERELATIETALRSQLADQFAPELNGLPEADREPIIDACSVLTNFDSFDTHHRVFGHDDDQTAESWSTGLRALLRE